MLKDHRKRGERKEERPPVQDGFSADPEKVEIRKSAGKIESSKLHKHIVICPHPGMSGAAVDWDERIISDQSAGQGTSLHDGGINE